jgi:hypothetical protein
LPWISDLAAGRSGIGLLGGAKLKPDSKEDEDQDDNSRYQRNRLGLPRSQH